MSVKFAKQEGFSKHQKKESFKMPDFSKMYFDLAHNIGYLEEESSLFDLSEQIAHAKACAYPNGPCSLLRNKEGGC